MKSVEDINETVCQNGVTQVRSLEISSSLDPDINSNIFEDNSDVNFNCSSRMNEILDEFTKLYIDKLQRIDDVSAEDKLKNKLSVLECWVKDLGEQNSILVSTVEGLEREASRRVSLLQEKLDKMAVVTRDSCLSLRDHQVEVTSLIKQKLTAEDEVKNLQDKVLNLEESKNSLLQENSFLRQDFDTVLELLSRGRLTGRWDCSDFTFNLIRPPESLLNSDLPKYLSGNISPKNFEGSESPKSRRTDSLSSLLSTEEEMSVPRLKQEIHNLRKIQRETNQILTQRDKHIADLQAQLTDVHHRFSAAQAQVENTTSTLHSLMDRGRQDSFEIFRRDDVIRQLLSPCRRLNYDNISNFKEEEDKGGKVDAAYQLSTNIDILADRLTELEEECSLLRRQNLALKLRTTEQDELLSEHKNGAKSCEQKSSNSRNIQFDAIDKQTQTVEERSNVASVEKSRRESLSEALKISKLENELSEKNILIRELQNHLVLSREEIKLKDETLHNIEHKLDCCKRNYDEKEERMLYLTSQLTNLQLEVSRLHGNLQQMRMQLNNKSELVLKLEYENRSLVRQLNEKSSVYEGIQKDFAHLISDIEKKKKEIAEQKLTIGTLQDALVATKINCDKLKSQYMSESDYNSAFNMSLSSILRLGEKDKTAVNSSRETLHSLSLTLPDIRSLNTDSLFLHKNCPDVVSVSGNEKLRNEDFSHTLHSSLKSLHLNEEQQQSQTSRDGSTSLQPRSADVKSLTYTPSTSINSCNSLSPNDYSSPMIQSPTDSGIGTEEFSNDTKGENGGGRPDSIKENYGKIFDI